MNKTPRRYKKIDNHTIQLIVEKATDIDLAKLIEGRDQLIAQIKDLNERLINIKEIIAEADKLGIVPKIKDKDVERKRPIKEGRGEKSDTPKPKI